MKIVRRVQRVTAAVAAVALLGVAGSRLAYPPAHTVAVTDTYFGKTIPDPFRWLEDAKDPAVIAWSAAQTKLALDFIAGQPSYAGYKARIAELSRTSTQRFGLRIRRDRWFYLRQTPPQPQPELVVRDGPTGTERVLFDPATAANGAAPPAIESVFVAPDGSKVAFTTQQGGAEQEALHTVDATSGLALGDVLTHVGGGPSPFALAWDGDGKGFIHTQWPQSADGTYATSNILIMHHVLGTDPAADTYVFGRDVSPRAEYQITASLDGKMQALFETDGDGVHASVFLRESTGSFTRVATPDDAIGSSSASGGTFVGDSLDVVSDKRDSHGEVVAIAPGQTFESGKVIVSASDVIIEDVVPVAGGFATSDSQGGDGSARLFETSGKPRGALPVPTIATLTELASDPRTRGPIIIGYVTYTTPNKWLAFDPSTKAATPTGIAVTAPGDFSGITAERVFVPSLDGKAQIPLEIVHAKNIKLDGSAPTVLTAYGAYGTISRPYFSATSLAWLERGGVFAQAMIRGGGEYGEAWHQAARLATKTVSSDDLAACAAWLGAHGFGKSRHLGIIGGSAGGFLMGLALTRDPQLYRAVVSEVGIYDLLRVELTPNGAYNTPEFGTVKDPAQFDWMLKQSPYHNVVTGRSYPAVLLTTGENDPRVDPYMSRKMIARLQADSASTLPELLIQRAGQGHGIGNSFDQRIESVTEIDSFFDSQLR
jgi:prolyl oligopeptidase